MFQMLITMLIVIFILLYVIKNWRRWFNTELPPLNIKKETLKKRKKQNDDLAEEVEVTEKLTKTTAKKNKSKKNLVKANTKLKQEETKNVSKD